MKLWPFLITLLALFPFIGVGASNQWNKHSSREVGRTVLERKETFRPGIIKEDLLVLDSIFENNVLSEVVTSRIKKERFVVVDSVAVGQRMLFNTQGELFLTEHFSNGKLERVDCLYPRHQNLIPNGSFEQVGDIKEHIIYTDFRLISTWASDFEHERIVQLDELRLEGKDTVRLDKVTDTYYNEVPDCHATVITESFFVFRNGILEDSIFSKVIFNRWSGKPCIVPKHNCNYIGNFTEIQGWQSIGNFSPKIINGPAKKPHHPLEGSISYHRHFETICGNHFAQVKGFPWHQGQCVVRTAHPVLLNRLNTSLQKGRQYKLSFWIWKPQVFAQEFQFAVGFWQNEPDETNVFPEKNLLIVSDFENDVIGEWYKVDLVFRAADFFRYLTVGFHNYEPSPPYNNTVASCYIDSFVLVPDDIADQDVDKLFYPDIILAAHPEESNLLAADCEDTTEQPVSPAGVESQIDLEGEKKVNEISEFSFGPILFETNSADLNFEAFQMLDRLVRFLKENSHRKLQIIGHTDNAGTPELNLDLSTRRAGSVAEYIVGRGIEEERLHIKGLGSTMPADTNETPEGMQKNRRVELSLYAE
jgi:outer membrane protein OmpA-like peptidoglycan-associated protein